MLPSKEPDANGWQEAVPLSLPSTKGTLHDVACPQCEDQLFTVEEITDTVQYEGYSAAGRALLKCPRCQTFYVVNWQSIYSIGHFYY